MRLQFLPALLFASTAWAGPIAREAGAIYLADFSKTLPRFPLTGPAACFFEANMQRYAGTLRFPQSVQLDAVSAEGNFRIRGSAKQGGVAAWIEPQFLANVPGDLVDNLRKAEDRRRQVEELIANNEVAIGMTLDEVTRSLGKPQKKSSRVGRDGSTQVFEYIKYDIIPQTAYTPAYRESIVGFRPDPRDPMQQPRRVVVSGSYGYDASTIYLKVPVGTVKVSFINGLVESIEQSEGTLAGSNATLVVPPINVGW